MTNTHNPEVSKVIRYKDATITLHAPIFGTDTVDVVCRDFKATGLTIDQFMAMIYPSILEQAVGKLK